MGGGAIKQMYRGVPEVYLTSEKEPGKSVFKDRLCLKPLCAPMFNSASTLGDLAETSENVVCMGLPYSSFNSRMDPE